MPSQDGERTYRVQYGESEYCSCPDHFYRATNCVHVLAVGIYCAKHRIRPEVAAGDPFAYAGSFAERLECPACYRGLVYIGHLEMTEEGEEVEVIEAAPCKRCSR